jgi:uncharacterized protein involved in exopolysaccharide biosynthesis
LTFPCSPLNIGLDRDQQRNATLTAIDENEDARGTEIPGEFDLLPILNILRARWRILALALAIGLVGAAIKLHISVPLYTNQLQVVAVDQGKGASASQSQFANIASLVGISVPSSTQNSFDIYLQGLVSRVAAERLAMDQNLMKRLYKSEWDPHSNRWYDPAPRKRALMNSIRGIVGLPEQKWAPPDAARLAGLLASEVDVESDKQKPVVTIVYKSDNPQLGRDLLWRLNEAVDNVLRERVLARTSSYVDYLTAKLNTIGITDYREAIIGTLSSQEEMRMAASSRLPFVAEPFGPTTSSAQPTSPLPLVVYLVAIIVSLLAGGAAAIWIQFKRPDWIRRHRWL